MARLVLQDPSITAKEIAHKLGYVEQKSVYYWLQKAGFTSIREFRKAVLSGTFPITRLKGSGQLAKDAPTGPRIPIQGGDGRPDANLEEYMAGALGSSSFALSLPKGQYGSLAREGDLLIIDPGASVNQGDLVVANRGGDTYLARRYWHSGKGYLYVEASDHTSVLTPDFVTGRVIFILRSFV